MAIDYAVSGHVTVHDEEELLGAAIVRAMSEGMTFRQAYGILYSDDEVNVSACLIMMIDPGEPIPGCEIHEFTAE